MLVSEKEETLSTWLNVSRQLAAQLLKKASYSLDRAIELHFAENGEATGASSTSEVVPRRATSTVADQCQASDRNLANEESSSSASPPATATPKPAALAIPARCGHQDMPIAVSIDDEEVSKWKAARNAHRGAYHAAFSETLQAVCHQNHALFLPGELVKMSIFLDRPRTVVAGSWTPPPIQLPRRLSLDAQALYARLFSSRRSSWVRVVSLLNYHEAFAPVIFAEEALDNHELDHELQAIDIEQRSLSTPSLSPSVRPNHTHLETLLAPASVSKRLQHLQVVIRELKEAGLLQCAQDQDSTNAEDLRLGPLSCLTSAELKELAAIYKKDKTWTAGSKQDLLDHIVRHISQQRSITSFFATCFANRTHETQAVSSSSESLSCSSAQMSHIQHIFARDLASKTSCPSFLLPHPGIVSSPGLPRVDQRQQQQQQQLENEENSAKADPKTDLGDHDELAKLILCVRLSPEPRALYRRALRLLHHTTSTGILATPSNVSNGRGVTGSRTTGSATHGSTSAVSEGSVFGAFDEEAIYNPDLMSRFQLLTFEQYSCENRSFRIFRNRQDFIRWEAAVELRRAMNDALFLWERDKEWRMHADNDVAATVDDNGEGAKGFSGGTLAAEAGEGDDDDEDASNRCSQEITVMRAFFGDLLSHAESSESARLCLASAQEDIPVVRLAKVALAAAKRLHEEQQDTLGDEKKAPKTPLRLVGAPACPWHRLPAWIEHMTAGAMLVSIVSDGIAALEKLRRYDDAVTHLQWLLDAMAQPFVCHKRGRWYERLVIDIDTLRKEDGRNSTSSPHLASWLSTCSPSPSPPVASGGKRKRTEKGSSSTSNSTHSSSNALLWKWFEIEILRKAVADCMVRGGDRLGLRKRLAKKEKAIAGTPYVTAVPLPSSAVAAAAETAEVAALTSITRAKSSTGEYENKEPKHILATPASRLSTTTSLVAPTPTATTQKMAVITEVMKAKNEDDDGWDDDDDFEEAPTTLKKPRKTEKKKEKEEEKKKNGSEIDGDGKKLLPTKKRKMVTKRKGDTEEEQADRSGKSITDRLHAPRVKSLLSKDASSSSTPPNRDEKSPGPWEKAGGMHWPEELVEEWLIESGITALDTKRQVVVPSRECGRRPIWLPVEDEFMARRLNRTVGMKNHYVGGGEWERSCHVEDLALQRYAAAPVQKQPSNRRLVISDCGSPTLLRNAGNQGTAAAAAAAADDDDDDDDDDNMGGGWSGLHCEGRPLRELFSLLLWDAIFKDDIPDVFQTPFQNAPLDLDSAAPLLTRETKASAACYGHHRGFYATRKDCIEDILQKISDIDDLEDIDDVKEPSCSTPWQNRGTRRALAMAALVEGAWKKHFGVHVRGLNWKPGRHSPLAVLQAVAVCAGGKTLAAIFRTLALNYRHYSGGLPDLLLLRALRRPIRTEAESSCPSAVEGEGWQIVPPSQWLGEELSRRLEAKELGAAVMDLKPAAAENLLGESTLSSTTETSGTTETMAKKCPGAGNDEGSVCQDPAQKQDGQGGLEEARNECLSAREQKRKAKQAEAAAYRAEDSKSLDLSAAFAADKDNDPDNKGPGEWRFEFRLVEVKGPTDALSHRQQAWLAVLCASGIDARICKITDDAKSGGCHQERTEIIERMPAGGPGQSDGPDWGE